MEDRLLNLNDPVQSLEILKMSTSHCTQVFSDYPLNTERLAMKKKKKKGIDMKRLLGSLFLVQ